MDGTPIDVVVAHVDGTAPGFAALHTRHVGAMTPCQMRDNGELRYVLRSIAAHAPWVRRVYLAVMDDSHVPTWVNRSTINVVHHTEFMPRECVPTFHWQGICPYLHRIPGLADHFIILPDDACLGRPAEPGDFFRAGLPRTDIYDSPIIGLIRYVARDAGAFIPYCLATRAALNTYLRQQGVGAFTRAWGHYLYPHGAMPSTRQLWEEMLEHMQKHPAVRATLWRQSRADRGGHHNYILLNLLFCGWVERVHRRRAAVAMLARCLGGTVARLYQRVTGRGALLYATYRLCNNVHETRRQMRRLLRQRPQRFCVNDEAYDSYTDNTGTWRGGWQVNPHSLELLHATLRTLYPARSIFEVST